MEQSRCLRSLVYRTPTANSDIDLVVSGTRNSWALYDTLRELVENPSSGVGRLDQESVEVLYAYRAKYRRVAFEDLVGNERHEVIQAKYGDRDYFIRFIKGPEEIAERYGDKRYRPVGRAKIKAMVVNDEEAIFTPCPYSVSDVSFIRGRGVSGLTEITSYRGRFCEQARQGETLVASGKLEAVSTRGGGTYHRLVVGGYP